MPEFRETCKRCGRQYQAIWHYSSTIAKGDGYAERLCCKAAGREDYKTKSPEEKM